MSDAFDDGPHPLTGAGAVVPRPGWHVATVIECADETPTARRITLDIPTWPGNLAGQRFDVRLTAPDGYQATRSYSAASFGFGTRVELAVEQIPGGEISPFLVRELRVGDQVEVHGPLGAFFVWTPDVDPGRPVQLVAGGSGVVPLVGMARAHAAAGDDAEFRMLESVRSPESEFYRAELDDLATTGALRLDRIYTRSAPDGWPRPPGRVTRAEVAATTAPPAEEPRIFVCGPTPFVETMARMLIDLGHDRMAIRTERFGGA